MFISEKDKIILNSIFNPLLPLDESISIEDVILDEETDDIGHTPRSKEMEKMGVIAAEKGKIDEAIKIFSESLLENETASGYNNRAQAYRLISKNTESLNDLNKSLLISSGKGRSGCQALCQRGLLYRKSNHIEEAREDFQRAAELGSQFAKEQLVQLNPYAAMCNKMLNEMMMKLTNPLENQP